MAEQVRFGHYQDYVDYLTRLELVPGLVNQTIDLLALGAAEGRTPPRVTLGGLPDQFDALVAPGGGLSALAGPLGRMPQQITAAQQQELRERFDDVSMPGVILAVEAFHIDGLGADGHPINAQSSAALS